MLRLRLTQDAQGAYPVATALQGQGIDIAVAGIGAFRFGSLAQPLQGFAAALLADQIEAEGMAQVASKVILSMPSRSRCSPSPSRCCRR